MFKYTYPITPANINNVLEKLIQELVFNKEPVYVDVKPINNIMIDECFALVKNQVETHGGKQINGWALWELPTLYCEAEFHSVWENPNGVLIDITPKRNQAKKVLFLHDSNLEYENVQRNNVRRKIKNIQVLDDFFETFDREFDLLNKGQRATQYGKIILSDQEAYEMQDLTIKRSQCFSKLEKYIPKANPYLPCPCGSGKKIKWCHKEYLK